MIFINHGEYPEWTQREGVGMVSAGDPCRHTYSARDYSRIWMFDVDVICWQLIGRY